jgi:hypothetical protein
MLGVRHQLASFRPPDIAEAVPETGIVSIRGLRAGPAYTPGGRGDAFCHSREAHYSPLQYPSDRQG